MGHACRPCGHRQYNSHEHLRSVDQLRYFDSRPKTLPPSSVVWSTPAVPPLYRARTPAVDPSCLPARLGTFPWPQVAHSLARGPPLLALALRLVRAARPLRPHARRLDLERLAAVELDRLAALALALVPVEVSGDAALAVQVRAAGAVDLHPLVHEGGALRACEDGAYVYVEA